eukprot:266331-Prorocentrum_lima.AAC.1
MEGEPARKKRPAPPTKTPPPTRTTSSSRTLPSDMIVQPGPRGSGGSSRPQRGSSSGRPHGD